MALVPVKSKFMRFIALDNYKTYAMFIYNKKKEICLLSKTNDDKFDKAFKANEQELVWRVRMVILEALSLDNLPKGMTVFDGINIPKLKLSQKTKDKTENINQQIQCSVKYLADVAPLTETEYMNDSEKYTFYLGLMKTKIKNGYMLLTREFYDEYAKKYTGDPIKDDKCKIEKMDIKNIG